METSSMNSTLEVVEFASKVALRERRLESKRGREGTNRRKKRVWEYPGC